MDIALNESKFTTSMQIPMRLRKEIKARGYTLVGAFTAGWAALNKADETEPLKKSIDMWKRYCTRLKDRIDELEGLHDQKQT